MPRLALHVSGPCGTVYVNRRHLLTTCDTYRPVLDPLVLDPAREPLERGRPSVVLVLGQLRDRLGDDGALVGQRAQNHGVAGAREEDQRPALELPLFLRGRAARTLSEWESDIGRIRKRKKTKVSHDAVEVRTKDAAAEDRQGVADVADRVSRDRL